MVLLRVLLKKNCVKIHITEFTILTIFKVHFSGIKSVHFVHCCLITTIHSQNSFRLKKLKLCSYETVTSHSSSPHPELIFIDVILFAFQREKGKILLCFWTLNILIQDSSFIGLHMKKIFLKWLRLWLMVQM